MKLVRAVLGIVLAGGLAACSPIGPAPLNPAPRERLAENMVPILKIEERYNQLKEAIQILGSMGKVNGETLRELKGHSDIYYLYYWASAVHLAGGNLESYLAHVRLAEGELEAIEVILKANLAQEPKAAPGSATDSQMVF